MSICWRVRKSAKRYVLLMANADLSDAEMRDLAAILKERHGEVKLISVNENPRAIIVKTTNYVAPSLRGDLVLAASGKRLVSVSTSGAVGNLKRRAKGSSRQWPNS